MHDIVRNRPTYNFGEFLAFDHFHRTEGWRGFGFFVLAAIGDMAHGRYSLGGKQIAHGGGEALRRVAPSSSAPSLLPHQEWRSPVLWLPRFLSFKAARQIAVALLIEIAAVLAAKPHNVKR